MDVPAPEQSIVCGVDRGEEGARALSMASWLADRMRARLELIHVAPEPPDRPGRAYGSYASAYDARLQGAEVVARAESLAATAVSARPRLLVDEAAAALAQTAENERAAMLVVGSRGHGAAKAALLGSVSNAVVESGRRPVVVVTTEALVPATPTST